MIAAAALLFGPGPLALGPMAAMAKLSQEAVAKLEKLAESRQAQEKAEEEAAGAVAAAGSARVEEAAAVAKSLQDSRLSVQLQIGGSILGMEPDVVQAHLGVWANMRPPLQ